MNSRKHNFIAIFFLCLSLFAALPKSYIHQLYGHNHSVIHSHYMNEEKSVDENTNNTNCDLNKFETPVYFTLFKFILDFKRIQLTIEKNSLPIVLICKKIVRYIFQLRAPPIAH